MNPTFSIIAPVYNEQAVLPEFVQRVRTVMEQTGEPWELILVDDGSRDRSPQIIASLHENDRRVKGISFSRNFGFQVAVTAGLDHARGEAVILTDADLQDPPEVYPEMIARWKQGYDVVYGVRQSRAGESWFKLVTAKLFYRLIRRLTTVDIPLDTGDFRLMDRRVVDSIRCMPEHNRFLRGMVPWVGFKQTGVHYLRQPRYAGESKFRSLKQMLPFALDAITSFSYAPLRLASYTGGALAGMGALCGLAALLILVVVQASSLALVLGGLGTLLFLFGIQLLVLGILGEYLGRIFDEVRARPLYLVRQSWGYPPDEVSPGWDALPLNHMASQPGLPLPS